MLVTALLLLCRDHKVVGIRYNMADRKITGGKDKRQKQN